MAVEMAAEMRLGKGIRNGRCEYAGFFYLIYVGVLCSELGSLCSSLLWVLGGSFVRWMSACCVVEFIVTKHLRQRNDQSMEDVITAWYIVMISIASRETDCSQLNAVVEYLAI